jgi:tetratricopeptide (TPR) repeat protein
MLDAMPRNRDPDAYDPARRIPADPARPERREPVSGPVDASQFDFAPVRTRLHAPPPRRWWLSALLALAVVLGLLLLFRRPLADRIWPQTSAQALRAQAAQALAQGRLSAADGSGARELYAAALAVDPDRNEAREGLVQVAQAALAQARTAIAAGRFDDAHRNLALAQALSVPRAQADAVETSLRKNEAARAGIAQLLARSARARAEHRLDRADDAALPLYQRVLALQPERVEALEGREDALADLLQQAQQALSHGELARAASSIAAARGYDAGHGDLPDAEAALARALEQARQQADGERRRGRLEQAADEYRALLAIDVGDSAALQGMVQVGVAWAHRAERLASDFRFADAKAALGRAQALAPKEAAVAVAGRHVARAQQAQARLGSTLAPGERRRRVSALLADAAAAEARGDLLAPPGDSAFDKLRAARAIAPDDAAVRHASERLLPAARECFERELRGNNLGRADACLDAWQVLDGGSAAVAQARRRLAERWLAFGDERLVAGELQRAVSALAAARANDPTAPGLDAFAQRLRAASPARQP